MFASPCHDGSSVSGNDSGKTDRLATGERMKETDKTIPDSCAIGEKEREEKMTVGCQR